MSTLQTKTVRLGDSATLANNFELVVPAVPDGTFKIRRQSGADVLAVTAGGDIQLLNTERSYTPVIVGGATPGVGTYSTQDGKYLDLGTYVFVRIFLQWSAHTGTGPFTVTLPIAPASQITPLAVYSNGINYGANNVGNALVIGSSISLYTVSTNGGGASVMTIDTAGELGLSGWYKKA